MNEAERHERVTQLFLAACELPEEERALFLDEQCADDPGLKADVEAMLAEDARNPRFLETPALGEGFGVQPAEGTSESGQPHGPIPSRIGNFKILEVLGAGGMGIVYLAEQDNPRRRVALKVIKPGMDTAQVLARFESERQALALMNHPHVAKVFDAGSTEQGRPYFVMEHISGVSITDYCDRHRLPTVERLHLFTQVCQAVQHAHQKGIIHRDLKPSNVLVAVEDGKPVPKVIDFGVAKATGHRLTEITFFSEQGQLIGTPDYMSPEQAEMTTLDIDTRTDIYSLGVLLYELLVGALPFEPSSLREAAFGEIQRIIREEEPPKPSTRLSSIGDASSAVAEHRRTDPKSLAKQLQGDLDWMIMRAMDKDRTRRYATASEFADDIGRHLRHDPVVAGPPSAAYRVSKFVRRNRGFVAAVCTVFAVLVLGMVGTVTGWRRAIEAREAEAVQRQEAERQAAIAEAVNSFLNNDLLAAVAPQEKGRDVTVREVLDAASETIEGKFEDEPMVEAAIRTTLGRTYDSLAKYESAEINFRKAMELCRKELGEDAPDTATSMSSLAVIYAELDRWKEAEELHIKALDIRRRILGKHNADTLNSMNNLAMVYKLQGMLNKAEPLYVEAIEVAKRILGEDDRETLIYMNNLATCYAAQGKLDKAEVLHSETLNLRIRALGEEDPHTLSSMNNLAATYRNLGKHEKAEPLYLRLIEACRRVFDPDDPRIFRVLSNLCMVYDVQERYEKAEPVCAEAVRGLRKVLPSGHTTIGVSLANYGKCLTGLNRYREAESAMLEANSILDAALGSTHERTTGTTKGLVQLYVAWDAADPGKGYDAKAAEWRAMAPSASIEDPGKQQE